MEMLDRYLHAIDFWLPRAQRKDILAEISEDIHSQIEDDQAALGRDLTEAELETVLKQRGSPMLVANRYRPQQSLIGPVWFPTYAAILKIVAFGYVPLWMIVYIVVRRVGNAGESWGVTFLAAWPMLWSVAFVTCGVVTLIFAILQFTESKTHFLENWNPRELQPVRDPNKIPRLGSILELVFGVTFVLVWIAYASNPVLFNGPAFKLSLSPDWMVYFWGYLAIGIANIALSAANLRHPYWTVSRASCRLVSDLASGALFCWLMKADVLATVYFAHVSASDMLRVKNAIQHWMRVSSPFAVIVVAIVLAVDLFRIYRITGKSSLNLTRGTAAV